MGRCAALAVLAVALALGGCGRRGKLEPPPDPSNPFALGTEIAPAPLTADGSRPADKTRMGTRRRPKNPPIKAPDEPFILDPLL